MIKINRMTNKRQVIKRKTDKRKTNKIKVRSHKKGLSKKKINKIQNGGVEILLTKEILSSINEDPFEICGYVNKSGEFIKTTNGDLIQLDKKGQRIYQGLEGHVIKVELMK